MDERYGDVLNGLRSRLPMNLFCDDRLYYDQTDGGGAGPSSSSGGGSGGEDPYVPMHRQLRGMDFFSALRSIMGSVATTGDPGVVDDVLCHFASDFCHQNVRQAPYSADATYALAYAVVALTFRCHGHSRTWKGRGGMTVPRQRFIDVTLSYMQCRVLPDSRTVTPQWLGDLYDEVVASDLLSGTGYRAGDSASMGLDAMMNVHVTMFADSNSDSDGEGAGTGAGKAASAGAPAEAGEADVSAPAPKSIAGLRREVEAVWQPMLAPLSVVLNATDDPPLVMLCVDTFAVAARLAALTGLTLQLDAFVGALGTFATRTSNAALKTKHLRSVDMMMKLASDYGGYLTDGEAWLHIFTRAADLESLLDEVQSSSSGGLAQSASAMQLSASTSYRSLHDTGGGVGQSGFLFDLQALSLEVNDVHARTTQLNCDAFAAFVKGLCMLSEQELAHMPQPRTYALTKLVELFKRNLGLNRVRLDWMRVVVTAVQHFSAACCHANVGTAKVALQLWADVVAAFLAHARELPGFHFRELLFLPFRATTQSRSVSADVRSQVLAHLNELIRAHGNHIGSGWTSLFSALAGAHKKRLRFEGDETTSLDAFDVVRTLLDCHTGQASSAAFFDSVMDCVNCLTNVVGTGTNNQLCRQAVDCIVQCVRNLRELAASSASDGGSAAPRARE